jgi:hypothetical protein
MTSGVLTGALKTERGTCRDDMDLRLVGMSARYLKRKQESAGMRLDQCDSTSSLSHRWCIGTYATFLICLRVIA